MWMKELIIILFMEFGAMVILVPDVIYQNLLKLPVEDRDVLIIELCFVVTPVINDTGGFVEEV